MLLLGLALAGLYVIARNEAGVSQVELDVSAHEGSTALALGAERDPVSPGCGCLDPSFGDLRWYGMALPSEGFELSVSSSRSPAVDRRRWALEVMAPEQDVVDWFAVPAHSLYMRVRVTHGDHDRTVFSGRVNHMVLLTGGSVVVNQPRRYPYAALLPAANGVTRLRSRAGARPGCCSAIDIDTSAPARASADSVLNDSYRPVPSLDQRGPMVDVLGPTVTFDIDPSADPTLWAGLEPVHGLRHADQIEVALRAPYSLRLLPHPAQLDWTADLSVIWSRLQERALSSGNRDELNEVSFGPRAQGRFVLTEPLPPYSVRLGSVEVPSDAAWKDFAHRSAAHDVVAPFLGANAWDDQGPIVEDYGLPPVDPRPEVGVFGPVASFRSTAVRGNVIAGEKTTPVVEGQDLSVRSASGVNAGTLRFTPLVSAGDPAEETTVAGRAAVSIDGQPVTRPGWYGWLPWLLGAIGVGLVGILLERGVEWMRHAVSHDTGQDERP